MARERKRREVWHENMRCIWMVSCGEEESEICPV